MSLKRSSLDSMPTAVHAISTSCAATSSAATGRIDATATATSRQTTSRAERKTVGPPGAPSGVAPCPAGDSRDALVDVPARGAAKDESSHSSVELMRRVFVREVSDPLAPPSVSRGVLRRSISCDSHFRCARIAVMPEEEWRRSGDASTLAFLMRSSNFSISSSTPRTGGAQTGVSGSDTSSSPTLSSARGSTVGGCSDSSISPTLSSARGSTVGGLPAGSASLIRSPIIGPMRCRGEAINAA